MPTRVRAIPTNNAKAYVEENPVWNVKPRVAMRKFTIMLAPKILKLKDSPASAFTATGFNSIRSRFHVSENVTRAIPMKKIGHKGFDPTK